MGQRSSCRSCRHCTPPRGEEMGWCQLRRLAIHTDLAGDLWCHHWTASPARLPGVGVEGAGSTGMVTRASHLPTRQLCLAMEPDEPQLWEA